MSEILSPNKYAGRNEAIRVIVIHTMEVPESDANVAESVGRAFANPATKASAHVGVDTNSECRYVADKDTAWAAPGANADGLQLELAGRAGQTTGNWADADSNAILELAAQRTAKWCRTHNIPALHLTDAQLGAGARGIVGHVQVSNVYKRSSHWDPGPAFPWASFMARVNTLLGTTTPTITSQTQEQIMADLILTNPATKADASAEAAFSSIWHYTFANYKLLVALTKAAGIDVDESAIAAQVLAGLVGPLKDAVTAAVTAGGSVDQVTDTVVARLTTAIQGA